jgi:hypothetical protein
MIYEYVSARCILYVVLQRVYMTTVMEPGRNTSTLEPTDSRRGTTPYPDPFNKLKSSCQACFTMVLIGAPHLATRHSAAVSRPAPPANRSTFRHPLALRWRLSSRTTTHYCSNEPARYQCGRTDGERRSCAPEPHLMSKNSFWTARRCSGRYTVHVLLCRRLADGDHMVGYFSREEQWDEPSGLLLDDAAQAAPRVWRVHHRPCRMRLAEVGPHGHLRATLLRPGKVSEALSRLHLYRSCLSTCRSVYQPRSRCVCALSSPVCRRHCHLVALTIELCTLS